MSYGNIVAGVIAILLPLLIAVYYCRRETNKEFIHANRDLDTLQGVFSIVSVLGGVLLIGQTALGFELGLAAIWLFIGLALFLVVLSFFAPFINKQSKKINAITIGELVSYNAGFLGGKIASLALFIIFFTILLGNILIGGSVISELTGINFYGGVIILSLTTLCYLMLGGFKVVVKTDFFQFLIMFIIGGLFMFFTDWSAIEISSVVHDLDLISIVGFLTPGLVLFASADVIQRIAAARTPNIARKMTLWSAPLFLIMGFIFTIIGVTAIGLTSDGNLAFLVSLQQIFPERLTPLGFLMILAAIMSTIDTELFYLSSSLVRDFGIGSSKESSTKSKREMMIIMPLVLLFALIISFFVPSIVDILFVALNIGTALGVAILYMFVVRGGKYGLLLSQLLGYGYFVYHLFMGYDPLTAANIIALSAVAGSIVGLILDISIPYNHSGKSE